jgi:hypothetical protein
MHWIWNEWRPRGRNQSRPRVSRAVEQARLAQTGVEYGLGGASAGIAAFVTPSLPMPAKRGGALGSAVALKLPTALVRESLRAARDAGRTIEEVWAEALGDWLTTQHESFEPSLEQHLGRIYKRQRVWGEIDETLHELRAS